MLGLRLLEGGVRVANGQVIAKGGMSAGATLVRGTDDIRGIEGWNASLKVVKSKPVFWEHRKGYPVFRRLAMAISDALKVMSLAVVEIGGFSAPRAEPPGVRGGLQGRHRDGDERAGEVEPGVLS